jgi:choline kinase
MPLTRNLPKCLVEVAGQTILDRMIERLEDAGIDDLIIVSGHAEPALLKHLQKTKRRAEVVFNPHYHDWGNFYSLLCAESAIGGDSFVKLDADVLLDEKILPRLVKAPGPAVLVIDRKDALGFEEMKARIDETGRVVELNKGIAPALALGESIGVERIDASVSKQVFAGLRQLIEIGETHEYYERTYERLMGEDFPFSWIDITDCEWREIDCAEDLTEAARWLRQ